VNLRATDQETARVVAILQGKTIVGAGCLVDGAHILTCYHVVEAALEDTPKRNARVRVQLIGVNKQPTVSAMVHKLGSYSRRKRPVTDLALLRLDRKLNIPVAEFATPLRHGGKKYSVLGFPDGDEQGRHASGVLHAADAAGLVQMDGNSALFIRGGFSGAPVWSPDLSAFLGMVVTEQFEVGVGWCIPSRVLCQFYPHLAVRFRIPLSDRPEIHDMETDDPNLQLFGTAATNGNRKLEASVVWNEQGEVYDVKVTFKRIRGSPPLRGKFVTFITYPDFKEEDVDSYELFSEVHDNRAWTKCYPDDLFSVAAIGDGGDTALTLDLTEVEVKSNDE
jgi:hypothetical protein